MRLSLFLTSGWIQMGKAQSHPGPLHVSTENSYRSKPGEGRGEEAWISAGFISRKKDKLLINGAAESFW